MTAFLLDTFTDADGTSLVSHTGETGATWTSHPNFSGTGTINSNRVYAATNNKIFYASGVPSSADQTVSADVYIHSTAAGDYGVLARMSTSATSWYSATLNGSTTLHLYKNSATQLGVATGLTIQVGETYTVSLTCTGAATTTIRVSLRRASDGKYLNSSGTWVTGLAYCISVTDSSSPVTAAGKAGIWLSNATTTTGMHITSVTAGDPATTFTAGVASTVSAGNTIASVTSTDATGGTSPYTYQWQRSTTSGSGFSNVSGATSLTLNDTGLTNETTYYYRIVFTDATASTVTSNETSATPTVPNDFTLDNASVFLSPYNWRLNGSTYAETNNPGAYLKTKFSGASCTLLLDTTNQSALSAGNYPAVSWQVNGGAWQRSQITAAQTTLSLATGLGAGPHTLEIVVAGAWWTSDRWTTPVSALRITGLRLATSATLSAATLQTGRMIVFADSNGEGYEALASGVSVANQDAGQAFPLLIAKALACEVGVIAFAGQGYNVTGGGNVPDTEDAWDFYSSGNSRLSGGLLSPAPDYILSTHGQNDSSGTQAGATACISQWLAASSATTKIALIAPMNLNQVSAIAAAVTAAANSRVKHINVGDLSACSHYVSGSHLSLRGHVVYAALINGAIKAAFPDGQSSTSDEWNLLRSIAASNGLELITQ